MGDQDSIKHGFGFSFCFSRLPLNRITDACSLQGHKLSVLISMKSDSHNCRNITVILKNNNSFKNNPGASILSEDKSLFNRFVTFKICAWKFDVIVKNWISFSTFSTPCSNSV